MNRKQRRAAKSAARKSQASGVWDLVIGPTVPVPDRSAILINLTETARELVAKLIANSAKES